MALARMTSNFKFYEAFRPKIFVKRECREKKFKFEPKNRHDGKGGQTYNVPHFFTFST